MRPDHDILKTNEAGRLKRVKSSSAFTLVEIILALAVMAIGLLGTLVLFPVGLTATRTASDNTEMATIASEYISIYQQAALNTNNYKNFGANPDVLRPDDYSPTNTTDSGATYFSHISVRNTGFSQITYNNITNTISRVTIELWRPGANTNTYVTEVARYGILP